jgi:hypothetical protein
MAELLIRWVVLSVSVIFLYPACLAHYPLRVCPGGFTASFIQMTQREVHYNLSAWKRDLELLRSVGIQTVILQYSGDEHGSYESQVNGTNPIRSLLAAAEALDLSVLVGLHRDPAWPNAFAIDTKLSPPLDQPSEMKTLVELCNAFHSCAGWYLPQEIDEHTWESAERRQKLKMFIERTSHKLRTLTPGKAIALVSFLQSDLDPQALAAWWSRVLANRPIDMLMLLDGVGTGRSNAESTQRLLGALWPITDALEIGLWAVVEVYKQIYGPPRDNLPFEAVPADFETVAHSMELERSTGARLAVFAYLKYMDPTLGSVAQRLHQGYSDWCDRNAGQK